MKLDLSVKIGRLKLKNPLLTASGTFGSEYSNLFNVNKLGAIVLKTITAEPRRGNPPPRIAETSSGMINSIGLENGGLEDFLRHKLPALAKIKIPIIASVAGSNEKEYSFLVRKLSKVPVIKAIELNLSCPNVKHGARAGLIAQDGEATYSIIRSARSAASMPLIAKLTPNVTDITKIAILAQKAKADALLIANTYAAMAVDIDARKPRLGNITGGLSGPAIKPITLKMVWDVYNSVDIPVIGSGGIMNSSDAIEYILCGATAVQIGTGLFVDTKAPSEIIDGMAYYCRDNKLGAITDLTGALKTGAM